MTKKILAASGTSKNKMKLQMQLLYLFFCYESRWK